MVWFMVWFMVRFMVQFMVQFMFWFRFIIIFYNVGLAQPCLLVAQDIYGWPSHV